MALHCADPPGSRLELADGAAFFAALSPLGVELAQLAAMYFELGRAAVAVPAGAVLVWDNQRMFHTLPPPHASTVPGLVVYRYDSPLFFANAEDFRRRAMAAVDDQAGPVAWFVLNMEANVEVDITALDAVERLRRDLRARGIVLALARVKQDLLTQLTAFGLAEAIGPDLIFPTLPTAVEAYRQRPG